MNLAPDLSESVIIFALSVWFGLPVGCHTRVFLGILVGDRCLKVVMHMLRDAVARSAQQKQEDNTTRTASIHNSDENSDPCSHDLSICDSLDSFVSRQGLTFVDLRHF